MAFFILDKNSILQALRLVTLIKIKMLDNLSQCPHCGGLLVSEDKKENMNFGEAIEALKNGNKIARKGWNGKGLFVFKQIPANITAEIIPKMQSVPVSVKCVKSLSETGLNYNNQMAIVNTSNGNVDSWVASSSDTFAEDWCIIEL